LFWAAVFSIFCVIVECLLNKGGHLVWEYEFWFRSAKGVWLIFLAGYFPFFCASILLISLKYIKQKIIAISVIYAVPVMMNVFGFWIMGWNY